MRNGQLTVESVEAAVVQEGWEKLLHYGVCNVLGLTGHANSLGADVHAENLGAPDPSDSTPRGLIKEYEEEK